MISDWLHGAGDLEITEQIAMGWQGLTSRAVKKVTYTTYHQHTAQTDY